MRVSDWFFTSDLHGQGALYEQLVGLVASRRPRAVLIGGDLCPHAPGPEGIARQRVFLQGVLVETARRLREASPETRLALLMGNDDWAANVDCLEQHHGGLWEHVHDRAVTIDGHVVAGLSWVPITPFGIKDWERWEDGEPETPARLDGWVSRGAQLEPCRFDPEQRTPTIADALADLATRTTPGAATWIVHTPPRGTTCDLIGADRHVGSRAVRAFIERHQPPLFLGGHIHESPRVPGGSFRDRIGRSVVVNPGQFGTPRLCGVFFDPGSPDATVRHTVFDLPRA
jgi:Icc-related predicted phosphoesterase